MKMATGLGVLLTTLLVIGCSDERPENGVDPGPVRADPVSSIETPGAERAGDKA